jgi:hypothetical protein
MPLADTLEDLYNFDGIEEGTRAVFEAANMVAYTRQNAATLEKETERIEIRYRLGGATGHFRVMADGSKRPDAWDGQLLLQVVTPCAANDHHTRQVALARSVAANLEALLNKDGVLPYHWINDIPMDAGTTPTIKTEDGYEYTTLTYNLPVCIRSEAWPEQN